MEKRKIIIFATIITFVIFSGCTQNNEENNSDLQTPSPETPTGTVASDDSEFIFRNATIEDIDILIVESFPVQINVIVKGYLPDSCTEIDKIMKNRDENIFSITITTIRPAEVACEQLPYFFEEVIPLDVYGLNAGVYNVRVNGVSGSFELTVDNILPD